MGSVEMGGVESSSVACYFPCMRASVSLLVLLCACGSCEETEVPSAPEPDARLLIITDLQGLLEPCGCTSRPLGGIDRMAAAVRAAGEDTIFLSAGNLLFGGASHAGPDAHVQDRWRAETAAGILADIDLAAAVSGDADADADVFPEVAREATLPLLEAPRVLEARGHRIGVFGVTGSDGGAAEDAATLREQGAEVVIALVSGGRRLPRDVAGVPGVDFVIQGGLDREEVAAPIAMDGGAHILHAGRQGQHLVAVDLYLRGEGPFVDASAWTRDVANERLDADIADLEAHLAEWEADGQSAEVLDPQRARLEEMKSRRGGRAAPRVPDTGNAFVARSIELDPDAPRDPGVRTLLERFDVRVNDYNQEEFADRAPPDVEEGMPHYVGSQACASCHAPAFSWWQSHPHGRAYATLTERHKEFHLECVGCHVTGYELPGGTTVTHNQDGALVNVGCEVCHGPGSAHIAAPEAASLLADTPERVCVGCHNEEHSDLFIYDAYRRTLVVPGHGLPP